MFNVCFIIFIYELDCKAMARGQASSNFIQYFQKFQENSAFFCLVCINVTEFY